MFGTDHSLVGTQVSVGIQVGGLIMDGAGMILGSMAATDGTLGIVLGEVVSVITQVFMTAFNQEFIMVIIRIMWKAPQ
jgi:hypothetical protein